MLGTWLSIGEFTNQEHNLMGSRAYYHKTT